MPEETALCPFCPEGDRGVAIAMAPKRDANGLVLLRGSTLTWVYHPVCRDHLLGWWDGCDVPVPERPWIHPLVAGVDVEMLAVGYDYQPLSVRVCLYEGGQAHYIPLDATGEDWADEVPAKIGLEMLRRGAEVVVVLADPKDVNRHYETEQPTKILHV